MRCLKVDKTEFFSHIQKKIHNEIYLASLMLKLTRPILSLPRQTTLT